MGITNVVLLHGALGAADQFAPLLPLLRDQYEVYALDFEGHGHAPLRHRPFRMAAFAENVVHFMVEHGIERAHLFGYSMGGYAACVLALRHAHLVESIATLGTKYHWTPEIAARETAMLDPHKMRAKVPRFVETLAARHTACGWETVVGHTHELLTHLGERGGLTPDRMALLEPRVRLMMGDRDSTVSLGEYDERYRALPNGQLEVLPNTPHPFERVSMERLAISLREFFG